MKKNAREKDLGFLKQIYVASYQVFLGIAAVTAFNPPLDFRKIIVIVFSMIPTFIFFMLGWRKFK